MAFNAAKQLRINIDAIRIALDWDGKRQFNEEEARVLKNYSGFGGLKAALYPKAPIEDWQKRNASEADQRLHPLVMELHKTLESLLDEQAYKKAVDDLDETRYKGQLNFDKEGTKVNAIRLDKLQNAEPEDIGKYLNKLYLNYKGPDEQKIGTLYGFDLYVRQQKTPYESNGMFQYENKNDLYAESPSGIKYLWNHGIPNTDNPKLAARYFLNAIDRVVTLREKYAKDDDETQKEIPVLRQLTQRTFDKDAELNELKAELKRLEKQISDKITAQANPTETKEAKVIPLDHSENLLSIRQMQMNQQLPDYGRSP